MKKSILFFLLVIVCAMTGKAQENEGMVFVDPETPFEEILLKAKQQNKLVFMDCYTQWCGPCKLMAANCFPTKEAGDFMNPLFVNVKMDMEHGQGVELAKRFDINAYPTLLVINTDGTIKGRFTGMKQPHELKKCVEEVLASNGGVYAMKAKYDAGERDPEFVKAYLHELDKNYMRKERKAVLKALIEGKTVDDLLIDKIAYDAALETIDDPHDPLFLSIDKRKEDFGKAYGSKAVRSIEGIWIDYGMSFTHFDGYDFKGMDTKGYEEFMKFMKQENPKDASMIDASIHLKLAMYCDSMPDIPEHFNYVVQNSKIYNHHTLTSIAARLSDKASELSAKQRKNVVKNIQILLNDVKTNGFDSNRIIQVGEKKMTIAEYFIMCYEEALKKFK